MDPRWLLAEPLIHPLPSSSTHLILPVSQTYYLLRSRADGRYLAARPRSTEAAQTAGFLLVFNADYDALSYLNTHAPELSEQFMVETVTPSSLKPLLTRWNFQGLGMVNDPLLPSVEFFNRTPDV